MIFGDIAPKQFEDSIDLEIEIIKKAKIQIEEYLSGNRKNFEIALSPSGADFQKQAWKELENIPFGSTITYGDQAQRLGKPSAARAVGAANGRNPLPIIVPCHRVVGANGSLGGFLGGLDIKDKLLKLAQSHLRLQTT